MSTNVMPFGITKNQLIEALDAVMPQHGEQAKSTKSPKADIGTTLSSVPGWVFSSPEWAKEYERLKVRHSMWWNFIVSWKPAPSDDATKVMAAINVMRDIAKRRHAEAKALDGQWRFLENSLKSHEAVFA